MEKFRSRKFCLLLYPLEDKTHEKALEFIKLNYDYALIVHDKDEDEEGKIKKAHTHIVISFPNAKWNTAVAEELGITVNYIEKCRNLESALEYLIHYNDDSKNQYSIDEVQGNLKSKLIRILASDGKDENEKVIELINYIKDNKEYIDLSDFILYCCSVGMYDVYRRSQYTFMNLIHEHNIDIFK